MEEQRYLQLIESSPAFKTLCRDAGGGRMSHAYLLSSGDSLALSLLTKCFLTEAVGRERRAAVFDETLSDVIYLPEEGEKVTVRDVDYLTETAYITPTELNVKFYVINCGETMNEAAQNKLLKTLEEPPAVTCVIILTASLAKMLPTVVSRCRTVTLQPFEPNKILSELKKYYPENERTFLAAAASRGSLRRAESILCDETYLKAYKLACDVLTNLQNSRGVAAYSAKLYDYRDYLSDIIDFMELLLRDGMAVECGCPRLAAEGFLNEITEISKRYPVRVALKEFPVLNGARRRKQLNGNINGIIDQLLFSLLEVRAKWK